ncbi:hypothetical protein RZO55_07810 [Clostridium boliviensis]|uniref:Uncharacterized protein n=1 Tax=Clostridium boliviensis TaxID=318465 RepID=A0ABU4GIN2_9CLOT|nr:hypothetical protein [Clostridium boliviensis]MDW2797478.1 hypothetical protein [Clostridium boliviensis]
MYTDRSLSWLRKRITLLHFKIKTDFNGEPLSIEFNDLARDYDDTYTLYYNYDLETYMMSYLDPCQDFIDFPYDYSGAGTFNHLVVQLELSDDNNIAGNGTVSGRKYTIEDLELLVLKYRRSEVE